MSNPAQSPPLLPVARDETTQQLRGAMWRAYRSGFLTGVNVPTHEFPAMGRRRPYEELVALAEAGANEYVEARSVPPLGSDQ